MQNTVHINLFEASREFMSSEEKRLKKKLIALLRDDGKGHRHAKYAERLEKFDIQIVPLKVDPMHTASISFDRGIITIGEGFLTDPATFYQLNVLLRHELAHNLLMHQVRLAYKLGEEQHMHMALSQSLHQLHNIIADDEISNRKYSEEDKIIIRNMTLNGIEIGGLVTEDHRKDWIHMSIEEMYDQICAEIASIQEQLLSGRNIADIAREKSDVIGKSIVGTYIYLDITSASFIPGTLQKFVESGGKLGKGKLRKDFFEVVAKLFKELDNKAVKDDEVKNLLKKIASSSPTEPLDLFDNKKIMLYTPEEKYIAVETLKKFKSEYTEWFDKVISSLDELSDEEIKELVGMLK